MFQILEVPLEKVDLRKGLISKNAGALNSFEGRVREWNEGKIKLTLSIFKKVYYTII